MSRHRPPTLTVLLAAATLFAGCGGAETADRTAASGEAPPTATVAFPAAADRTLADLRTEAPEGPILAPTVSVLERGKNRFGFALVDKARKQLTGAQVAVYAAGRDGTLSGPYPAREESLDVAPQFVSQITAADPDATKSIYVAEVPFETKGSHTLVAVASLDGRLVSSTELPVDVGTPGGPPDVGEPAIKVSTPTLADVGGNAEAIDTRVPPSTMHEEDFADVLGKKPVLLLFATPALCQSRVCGPVVDVAEQVKADIGDEAAWVHMEIFEDNQVDKGFREQVGAWKLPTEPWAFAIDADGTVVERLEGAFSVRELRAAMDKALAS